MIKINREISDNLYDTFERTGKRNGMRNFLEQARTTTRLNVD